MPATRKRPVGFERISLPDDRRNGPQTRSATSETAPEVNLLEPRGGHRVHARGDVAVHHPRSRLDDDRHRLLGSHASPVPGHSQGVGQVLDRAEVPGRAEVEMHGMADQPVRRTVRAGPTFLAQAAISAAVLTLLYFLNDVFDCREDVNDPGKDQTFVGFCVEHRARLFWVLALEKTAICALAWPLLGPRSAAAAAAIFLVNLGYSARFKRIPVLDVPFVALWGFLYAMVPAVDVQVTLIVLVGVMTAICHVHQITRDREFDVLNHIRTSAAVSRWLPEIQIALCCAAMAFILHRELSAVIALTAAVPFALRHRALPNRFGWMMSKAYFGGVWLVLLGNVWIAGLG